MKVAHVIIGLNVGGAELMLKRLVESHSQSEIEHIVISLTDVGVLGEGLKKFGIDLYCLGMDSIIKGPVTFLKLRKLIKRLHPDIVHTWMYHADLLGGLAARSAGFPNVVWCIRSTDIRKGGSRATLVIRKLCAWLSNYVPRVIVCAANASRQVHEGIGYAPSKMVVLPNGFDLVQLISRRGSGNSIRDELGIGQDCKLVISVGRFNPVKDHGTFIQAAGQVTSRNNDVKFILVGRGLEPSNAEISKMIEGTGRSDAFFLLGERKDVPDYLATSDVFCLHSITEGFPNVLGEAMAMGLPCVTTDVGDAAYLLGNAEWVVPPASPHQLAEKLNALLSLPTAERAVLGEAAAARIREHFTMDVISRRYRDMYTSLLQTN